MVSYSLKRTLFLVIGIFCIVMVTKCQVAEITWHRAGEIMEQKRGKYTPGISVSELDGFIRLWPEFNELGMLRDVEILNLEMKPSDVLTWKMRIWFAYRHWDAERFFYVRERILLCMREIQERQVAKDIIEYLKERDDDLAKQMIRLHENRIKAQKITDQELLLISSREGILKQLFKQYP